MKRMCLSRDQRAVLEAVYAMEKLPDADLRERLSSYLNLSTRQVQVWFQNRRQRAKANGPKKSALSTSDQIMEALLDFSSDASKAQGADGISLSGLGSSATDVINRAAAVARGHLKNGGAYGADDAAHGDIDSGSDGDLDFGDQPIQRDPLGAAHGMDRSDSTLRGSHGGGGTDQLGDGADYVTQRGRCKGEGGLAGRDGGMVGWWDGGKRGGGWVVGNGGERGGVVGRGEA